MASDTIVKFPCMPLPRARWGERRGGGGRNDAEWWGASERFFFEAVWNNSSKGVSLFGGFSALRLLLRSASRLCRRKHLRPTTSEARGLETE